MLHRLYQHLLLGWTDKLIVCFNKQSTTLSQGPLLCLTVKGLCSWEIKQWKNEQKKKNIYRWRLRQNDRHFAENILKNWCNKNCHILIPLSLKLFSKAPINHIFSDNGLAPNRQQAIIWTNDGRVYWCIYVSPDLNWLLIVHRGHCWWDNFVEEVLYNKFLSYHLYAEKMPFNTYSKIPFKYSSKIIYSVS